MLAELELDEEIMRENAENGGNVAEDHFGRLEGPDIWDVLSFQVL